ncbi:GAP1-N2 domain-containing protein [Corynebacterium sp. AOP40-9SA-29]|uniref:GAP1-N2 domain-containing protein n=1 Tax=Corynebacterium sp. AOP40-9SA-29 TaxID=3457677 RepID=UPI004034708F
MSGSFTYASFSPSDQRSGGWGVGHRTGELAPFQVDEVIPLIPTHLSDPVALPTFPDREELARRIRRFAWLPAPWEPVESADTGVFLASVPAGQDATGRPGNVFTYVFVSDPGQLPQRDAVKLMFSASVPSPYGKRKVDAAEGPGNAQMTETTVLSEKVIEGFLDGNSTADELSWPQELGRVRPHAGPVPRREILNFLVARIADGTPVVLLTDVAEGPLWITALADQLPPTLPADRSFTWSTYEKAATVTDTLAAGVSFAVVPSTEAEKMQDAPGVLVVNTAAVLPVVPDPSAKQDTTTTTPSATSSWRGATWAPVTAPVAASQEPQAPEELEEPETTSHTANPFDTGAIAEPVQPTQPQASPAAQAAPAAPAQARPTPEGTLPAIAFTSDIDTEFIMEASLQEWADACFEPESRHGITRQISQYLLLDPADDLGWTTRIRMLALASYGHFPQLRRAGRDRNEDALCAIDDADRTRLVKDTVAYTVRHGSDHQFPGTGQPDLDSLINPSVRRLVEAVYRGRQRSLAKAQPDHFPLNGNPRR